MVIVTDRDQDGSRVEGPLMTCFRAFWPSLLRKGFLYCLAAPLLEFARRGVVRSFFSRGEFENRREADGGDNAVKGAAMKCCECLSASEAQEAREWFEDLFDEKYEWDGESDDAICFAFSEKHADDREDWLKTYDPCRALAVVKGDAISCDRFVRDELIRFSDADNLRSFASCRGWHRAFPE